MQRSLLLRGRALLTGLVFLISSASSGCDLYECQGDVAFSGRVPAAALAPGDTLRVDLRDVVSFTPVGCEDGTPYDFPALSALSTEPLVADAFIDSLSVLRVVALGPGETTILLRAWLRDVRDQTIVDATHFPLRVQPASGGPRR